MVLEQSLFLILLGQLGLYPQRCVILCVCLFACSPACCWHVCVSLFCTCARRLSMHYTIFTEPENTGPRQAMPSNLSQFWHIKVNHLRTWFIDSFFLVLFSTFKNAHTRMNVPENWILPTANASSDCNKIKRALLLKWQDWMNFSPAMQTVIFPYYDMSLSRPHLDMSPSPSRHVPILSPSGHVPVPL